MFESYLKPPISFPTVSGSVCTFNSQYAGLPLKSHTVDIDSVSGVSAINIGSDNKYAGFINFNQLISDTKIRDTFEANGVLFTKVSNGFELSGEANAIVRTNYLTYSISYTNNHVYFLYDGLGEIALWNGYDTVFNVNGSIIKWNRATSASYTYCILETGVTYSGTIKPQIIDITALFERNPSMADYIYSLEQQTSGAGVAYFRSLFPNDYYDNNAGTLTTVSAVNGSTNSFFTIPIGQTVNEGVYDARTGILEVTSPSVQTIQLPPCPIDTLEGVNNIWADTGDTTLQYPKFG